MQYALIFFDVQLILAQMGPRRAPCQEVYALAACRRENAMANP
jgi:hypothetical protein